MDFLAEVRAAQFTMVHKLQRYLGFLCSSHHVRSIGYLQPDSSPTCGKTLWRKYTSLDKTDLGTCVTQQVEAPLHFPAQGTDLRVKLPLAANPAHGLQSENLQPFQKVKRCRPWVMGSNSPSAASSCGPGDPLILSEKSCSM